MTSVHLNDFFAIKGDTLWPAAHWYTKRTRMATIKREKKPVSKPTKTSPVATTMTMCDKTLTHLMMPEGYIIKIDDAASTDVEWACFTLSHLLCVGCHAGWSHYNFLTGSMQDGRSVSARTDGRTSSGYWQTSTEKLKNSTGRLVAFCQHIGDRYYVSVMGSVMHVNIRKSTFVMVYWTTRFIRASRDSRWDSMNGCTCAGNTIGSCNLSDTSHGKMLHWRGQLFRPAKWKTTTSLW